MQVSYRPCPLLPPLPTHSVADPNTFQIFLFLLLLLLLFLLLLLLLMLFFLFFFSFSCYSSSCCGGCCTFPFFVVVVIVLLSLVVLMFFFFFLIFFFLSHCGDYTIFHGVTCLLSHFSMGNNSRKKELPRRTCDNHRTTFRMVRFN